MASSDESSGSDRKPAQENARPSGKASSKSPMKSQKLVRTLSELESAFTSWQSLSSAKARQAATAAPLKKDTAKAADPAEEEFKQKTKKLLDQLRQQLAELND